jgi:hypothetical protein
MGWFDDFSTTGLADAGGSASRLLTVFNAFDLAGNTPQLLGLDERLSSLAQLGRIRQYKRCPGGAEVRAPDGSNVLTPEEQRRYDCTESARGSGIYPENRPGG